MTEITVLAGVWCVLPALIVIISCALRDVPVGSGDRDRPLPARLGCHES